MENKKERVLAFKLARKLDNEDLQKVAGGSSKRTAGPTGYISSYDGQVDLTVDW